MFGKLPNITQSLFPIIIVFFINALTGCGGDASDDDSDDSGGSDDDTSVTDDTGGDDDSGIPDDTVDDDSAPGDDTVDDDDTGETTTTTTVTTVTTTSTTLVTSTTTTSSTTTTTIFSGDCYQDTDLDGFGDPDVSEFFSDECPFGWAPVAGDCDDADILAFEGAPEIPDDGVDQNCDGNDLEMSNATGVFVAKTGNDSNPGTMASPKLTIGAGITLAKSEAKSVFVAEGEYDEGCPTTVSLFGGYESTGWTRDIQVRVTTIHAPSTAAVVVTSGPAVAITGFTLFGETQTADAFGFVNFSEGRVLLKDCVVGSQGDISDTTAVFSWVNSHLMLHGNDILAGSTEAGECSSYSSGVYAEGELIAVGNSIHGGGACDESYGVYGNAERAVLLNNEINGGVSAVSYAVSWGLKGIAVNNEIFGGSGTRSTGISAGDSDVIVGNIIDAGTAESTLGIFIVHPILESGEPTLIADNVIFGHDDTTTNYSALSLWAPAYIINNTIDCSLDDASMESNYCLRRGTSSYLGTAYYINNIIYGRSLSGESLVSLVGSSVFMSNDLLDLEDTCLLKVEDGVCMNDMTTINACGWSGCVQASGSINSDPVFSDLSSGDYRLSSASPCKDTGVDPSTWYTGGWVDFDFEGDARPYGAGWDIGADEWVP